MLLKALGTLGIARYSIPTEKLLCTSTKWTLIHFDHSSLPVYPHTSLHSVAHAKQLGTAYRSNDAGDGPSATSQWLNTVIMSNNINGLDGNLHFADVKSQQKRLPNTGPMAEKLHEYLLKFMRCHAPKTAGLPLAWCINETWMPDKFTPEKIGALTFFGRSRNDAKMGGVAVLVPDEYVRRFQVRTVAPPRQRTPVNREYQEIVWVQYKLAEGHILYVASVHMPSAATLASLGATTGDMVDQMIYQIRHFRRKGTVVVAGDFNMLRSDAAMRRIEKAIANHDAAGSTDVYLSSKDVTRPATGRAIDHIMWSGLRSRAKVTPICESAACADIGTDHCGIGAALRVMVDKNRMHSVPSAYAKRQPQRRKARSFDVRKIWGNDPTVTARPRTSPPKRSWHQWTLQPRLRAKLRQPAANIATVQREWPPVYMTLLRGAPLGVPRPWPGS